MTPAVWVLCGLILALVVALGLSYANDLSHLAVQ